EAGAAQAQFLRAPPGEAQMFAGLEPGRGDLLGDLENRRGTGAVVVDARAGGDAVEVGAGHEDLVRVAAGPVGDQVEPGEVVDHERLDRGGVAGRVELGLDVVERGPVAGAAVGAGAAVVVGDGLQLRQV